MTHVVAGIFVGGAGARMGGWPKGLMRTHDGHTLVERARTKLVASGVTDVVLVGANPAYAHLPLRLLRDRPAGIGPLGGLVALLEHVGPGLAIAVACDMPFVSERIVWRLLSEPPTRIVAPRRGSRWEPLCARYDAARVLAIARRRTEGPDHSLQGLLDEAGASELLLPTDELLDLTDWDTPADTLRRS